MRMDDLIWVGNTLYPRGFVLLVAAVIILVVIGGIYAAIRAF